MNERKRQRMQKGFTLIEVIAALAIIGLGLVGILSLFPVGIDASKRAGELTTATTLGQSVLEQIRSAAKKGNLTLSDAEDLFRASPPMNFEEEDEWLRRDIVPVNIDRIPRVRARGGEQTYYQYQVEFEDPPDEEKLDDLGTTGMWAVGLQKVTVTVSWPADEPDVELRNKITLVTFIRFPR